MVDDPLIVLLKYSESEVEFFLVHVGLAVLRHELKVFLEMLGTGRQKGVI
jgi:hypothetical protein